MALGMSSADIAYSANGIDSLKTEITGAARNIKNKIDPTATAFVELEKTIRNNWSGADCDKYVNDLKKAANELTKSCDDMATKLNNALENFKGEFNKMQNTTYTGINVKRNI